MDSNQPDSSRSILFQTSHHPPGSVEDADWVSQVAADCRRHLPPTATPWQLTAAQEPPHPVTCHTVITIWLIYGTQLSYSGRGLWYKHCCSRRWLLYRHYEGCCCLLQGRRAGAGLSETSVAQMVEALSYKLEGWLNPSRRLTLKQKWISGMSAGG